jgi:hypothetical protein
MSNHSLSESAALICGADDNGEPLPGKAKWVMLRLRRGEFSGYKVGRQWRMTDEDIAAAIESLRPRRVFVPEIPAISGMTRTSARRLVAS